MAQKSLGVLLEELAQAGLTAAPAEKPLPAALAPAADNEGSPWYVKALVGVAAWIAAVLLGIFFGALGVIDTGEQMVGWGIGLLVAAIVLKWWQRTSIFWGQLAFAVILAGQGLFLVGVGMLSESATTVALVAIGLELLLLVLYPDTLHRMFSVLAIVGALTFLVYDQDWPSLIHVLIFVTAAGAVLTWQNEFRLLTSRLQPLRAPLGYGFALALFGLCLVAFSGWYGAVQWWISTALLALTLLYLLYQVFSELALPLIGRAGIWALAAILVLLIPAYDTPGILAAVLVLLLGRWRSNGLLLGIAAIFLLFFLSSYYYNLEITLLNKSYILMGTGAALLAAWWGLRRVETVSQ
ncbi:MAG: DUF4401 domain-containing protein [Caldilineaceae bacterium]|nr:DUF4401 domain-containing protein [Caldilineaceae bacterium]